MGKTRITINWLYILTARVHIASDHYRAVTVEWRVRVIRLLVRLGVQLDEPVHVMQVPTPVDRTGRMTVAVMADRAARAGILVASARAAATSGRHARTSAVATGGQRALAHQRAGETLPLPVPGHDQENGDRQQYDDGHQYTDDDRHVGLVLVFGRGHCAEQKTYVKINTTI